MKTDKILSVLNLTTSDNDHEALAAIRTANSILKKHKSSWNEFFKMPKVHYQQQPPKQEPKRESKNKKSSDALDMISFIRENAWATFNFDFVDSLEESFNKYGSLTDKQYKALKKIYNLINKDDE